MSITISSQDRLILVFVIGCMCLAAANRAGNGRVEEGSADENVRPALMLNTTPHRCNTEVSAEAAHCVAESRTLIETQIPLSVETQWPQQSATAYDSLQRVIGAASISSGLIEGSWTGYSTHWNKSLLPKYSIPMTNEARGMPIEQFGWNRAQGDSAASEGSVLVNF